MALDAPPLLQRRCLLLAGAETTTGTAPATITDGTGTAYGQFVAYNPVFRPIIPPIQRPAMDTSENLQAVRGATHAELTFECDLMGSGSSGMPTWASTFLPACNMVLNTATYTFQTQPTTINSISIGYNESGRLRLMTGCMGSWTIPFKAGEIARIRFRFMGLLAIPDTDIALVAPNVPTVVPPRWAQTAANGFIWSVGTDGNSGGTFKPITATCEFNSGNNVVMRQDANTDPGYRSALVSSRDPTATASCEACLVATFNWGTAHKNSYQAALTAVLGTTANNVITLAFPKASLRERNSGARDGIITEEVVWQANRNANTRDGDCTIVFS